LNSFKLRSWSPWLVGAAIGVLSWFSFATADKPIGITTAFEYTAALATRALTPAQAEGNPYFTAPDKSPKIGWEWMLVAGVFSGAFVSSKLSGDRASVTVPPRWARRFGTAPGKRYAAAFAGGALLLIGARLAGGCTSGHGISGTLQLAVSSWLFLITIFAAGATTALLLYGRRGDSDV
jgi:uncharacterized membrane protein YedE/YeeE